MVKRKSGIVGSIVGMSILGVAALVFLILSFVINDSEGMNMAFLVISIICFVCFFIVLLFTISNAKKLKRRDQNIATAGTVANKVLGENTKFKHFSVVPNSKEQSDQRAVQNTLGVLSFIFLGVGFFSWGKNYQDLFISDDELFVRDPKNMAYEDGGFSRCKSSDVASVSYQTVKKYERVTLRLVGGSVLNYDIAHSQCDAQTVRETFDRFAAHKDDVFPTTGAEHFCDNCGSKLEVGSAFCAVCGNKINASAEQSSPVETVGDEHINVCPNCGVEVKDGETVCSNCGNEID